MEKVTWENVLDTLRCMRALKASYTKEPDPRVRAEMAVTLDQLEQSFDQVLDEKIKVLLAEKAA